MQDYPHGSLLNVNKSPTNIVLTFPNEVLKALSMPFMQALPDAERSYRPLSNDQVAEC